MQKCSETATKRHSTLFFWRPFFSATIKSRKSNKKPTKQLKRAKVQTETSKEDEISSTRTSQTGIKQMQIRVFDSLTIENAEI